MNRTVVKQRTISDFETVILLSPTHQSLEFRTAWASFVAGLHRPVRLLTYSEGNGKAICYAEFVERYATRFGGAMIWTDRLVDGRYALYARPIGWLKDDRSF